MRYTATLSDNSMQLFWDAENELMPPVAATFDENHNIFCPQVQTAPSTTPVKCPIN
jgi:hypothetical protein